VYINVFFPPFCSDMFKDLSTPCRHSIQSVMNQSNTDIAASQSIIHFRLFHFIPYPPFVSFTHFLLPSHLDHLQRVISDKYFPIPLFHVSFLRSVYRTISVSCHSYLIHYASLKISSSKAVMNAPLR
jgi:hypothetical protein